MRYFCLSVAWLLGLSLSGQTTEKQAIKVPRHSLLAGVVPAGLGLQYQYRLLDAPGVQFWLGGSVGTTCYSFLAVGSRPDDYGFALSVTPTLLLGKKRGKLELSMAATAVGFSETYFDYDADFQEQRSVNFTSVADLFYIGYRYQPLEKSGFTFMGGLSITAFGKGNSIPVFPTARLGVGYSF